MGSAEDLAKLEKRIAVLERLTLRLVAENDDRLSPPPVQPKRSATKLTVKRAIIQVLDDTGRSMRVAEIQPPIEKLMGRHVSRQMVLTALGAGVQNNEVKRVARGVYRRVDQA
jgi:hypothetical protein